MKFKPIDEDIKAAGVVFDSGNGDNWYSTEKFPSIPDLEQRVTRWHKAGLCSIEGQEDNPRRAPIVDVDLPIDNPASGLGN